MKKASFFLLSVFCLGCVSVHVPKYLPEKFPYLKTYYASFEATLGAVQKSLADLGWRVADTANPAVFEQDKAVVGDEVRQILIFTQVRQTPLVLSSRYMNLNVYIRSAEDNRTDVEVRYMSVVPTGVKNIQGYKNDDIVHKLFAQIQKYLQP